MLEQQLRRLFHESGSVHAGFRQRAVQIERFTHGRRRFVARDGSAGQRCEAVRNQIHQPMPQPAECRNVHRERGLPGTSIVCGFLGCDVRPFNPVLESLPRLLHLPKQVDGPMHDRLASLVEFTIAESRDRRAGSKSVLLRLSEILFIEVVRRYLDSLEPGRTGWLAGLRDPLVGRALALLHDRPALAWTLDRLAKDSGASRSTLADRFAHVIGQPPMRYLTQWRMQLASRLLADGRSKVSAVALDVGYQSEAAFSRAFKDTMGVSPAAWRRSRSA